MTTETIETDAPAAATPAPRSRFAKLKLTDDGRPATLAEVGDERVNFSSNERIKVERSPFTVWDDIVNIYSKQGFDSIPADDFERMKWYGIYQQRPKNGHLMMRFKVPGGALNTDQVRLVAGIVKDYGHGFCDITTRQDIQVHWLTIEQMPDIKDRLATVGMTTRGACGDVARNVVSSPIAGIDPEELMNPLPLVNKVTEHFVSTDEFADMPRKHKMAIYGNRSGGQVEIHEIGCYAVKRKDDGSIGFRVLAGGGLSTEPFFAQDLGVFVPEEELLDVLVAISTIYRDHGYRKSRKHARFKYLVADWGAAKVRDMVEEFLGRKLRDAEPLEDAPFEPCYGDKLGIHPQKQEGYSFIGVPVPTGRITHEQMVEAANLADEFGSGEVRFTVMQNFLLPNIPNEHTETVKARLEAIGLPIRRTAFQRGVIACTGIQFCNLAVTETKERAKWIVDELDKILTWEESEFFRINVNGCPNSCGQHWLADVGLQGCTKKIDGELVEHFDFFVGGGVGTGASMTRRVKRVQATEVPETVKTIIGAYRESRQGNETFGEFCNRHTVEELQEMLP
jgi:sulfite reductase beta subunit-like hemoprotein